jgi:tRNA A37 methylthiotransferase MiaB
MDLVTLLKKIEEQWNHTDTHESFIKRFPVSAELRDRIRRYHFFSFDSPEREEYTIEHTNPDFRKVYFVRAVKKVLADIEGRGLERNTNLTLEITSECNKKCRHCYVPTMSGRFIDDILSKSLLSIIGSPPTNSTENKF